MSDDATNKGDPLDNSIEKLDTIIGDKEELIYSENIPVLNESADPELAQMSDPNLTIPVLDELVEDKSEEVIESKTIEQPGYSADQLMQLVDKLENKLNGELEMLINVIKGNMKETIVEEIRSQMDIFPQHSAEKTDEPPENRTPAEEDDSSLHHDGYRPYGQDDDI